MSIILLLHLFMLTFTFGHVELLTVDYHSIDTPIVELNNHTLREVFEGGNILLNPNFDTNTVWITRPNTTQNISGGINTITATTDYFGVGISQDVPNPNGSTFYTVIRFNSQSSNGLQLYTGGVPWTVSSTPNVWNIKSIKGIVTSDITYRIFQSLTIGQTYQIDYAFLINQTALGISSLTVEQMDTYFQMYQDNISGNDVTYIQNEMTITDLTYILGFSFVWFIIIWSIRKVVL